MPWYDLECEDCKEIRRNVAAKIEDRIQACPSCGGRSVRKISAPPLKFKGGGWATGKPVEAFPGESEYTKDWGKESHGLSSDLHKGEDDA